MPLFRDGDCPPLERWSEPAQIVFFAASGLAASFVIGFLFKSIGVENALSIMSRNGFSTNLFGAFVRAVCYPFIETVIGIWLPIFFMKITKRKPFYQIAFASVIYAILHLTDGVLVVLSTFFTGWILASGFVFCQQTGWLKAFRVVSVAAAIHNAVLLFLYHLLLK
jgi:hypothetical protein